jgi:hypothetical protein
VPCSFYPHTLYRNPLYQTVEGKVMPCPVAEACIGDAFWLPHRVLLAENETIDEIAGVIRNAIRGLPAESAANVEALSNPL